MAYGGDGHGQGMKLVGGALWEDRGKVEAGRGRRGCGGARSARGGRGQIDQRRGTHGAAAWWDPRHCSLVLLSGGIQGASSRRCCPEMVGVGILRWEDDSGRTPTPGCKSRRREGDGARVSTRAGARRGGRRWRAALARKNCRASGVFWLAESRGCWIPNSEDFFQIIYLSTEFYRASWKCF